MRVTKFDAHCCAFAANYTISSHVHTPFRPPNYFIKKRYLLQELYCLKMQNPGSKYFFI